MWRAVLAYTTVSVVALVLLLAPGLAQFEVQPLCQPPHKPDLRPPARLNNPSADWWPEMRSGSVKRVGEYADSEAYAVYEALLHAWDRRNRTAPVEGTVVNLWTDPGFYESIVPCLDAHKLNRQDQSAYLAAMRDFDVANTYSSKLVQRSSPRHWRLVSEEQLNEYAKQLQKREAQMLDSALTGFAERTIADGVQDMINNGYFSFSAVGYNPEKDRAVVQMTIVCGSLCGGGHYYALRKFEGKWQIDSKVLPACTWRF